MGAESLQESGWYSAGLPHQDSGLKKGEQHVLGGFAKPFPMSHLMKILSTHLFFSKVRIRT